MVLFSLNRLHLTVPPAELESVMLQHPDIADVAVIGIECKEEATELPRFVCRLASFITHESTYSLSWLAEPM
jgi:acyl-coenzyme A synthetase/AMP-(fatty) acid ligase